MTRPASRVAAFAALAWLAASTAALGAPDKPAAAPKPPAPKPAAKPAAALKLQAPLAKVNGKAITMGEYDQAYRGFLKGAHQMGAKQPPPEFRGQFLQEVITLAENSPGISSFSTTTRPEMG